MAKVFQYLEYQVQYHGERIGEVKKAGRGDEYVVRVYWQGLNEEVSTWEILVSRYWRVRRQYGVPN